MCQQSCGSTVANALRNVPGVSRAEASFADHNASVWGDVDVALLIDAVECVGYGDEESESNPAPPSTVSLKSSREFRIQGMRTLTDARRVEQAALKAGCQSAKVNVNAGRLLASLDGNARDVERAVTAEGYACEAVDVTNDGALLLKVEGMSCAACSSKVERALSEVPGVLRADVSVATHRARVVLSSDGDRADCVAAVKKCGFRCSLATRDESPAAASQREVAGWWRSLKVALLLSIPIFVAKWGGMIGPDATSGIRAGSMACLRSRPWSLSAVVCADLRRWALLPERLHAPGVVAGACIFVVAAITVTHSSIHS